VLNLTKIVPSSPPHPPSAPSPQGEGFLPKSYAIQVSSTTIIMERKKQKEVKMLYAFIALSIIIVLESCKQKPIPERILIEYCPTESDSYVYPILIVPGDTCMKQRLVDSMSLTTIPDILIREKQVVGTSSKMSNCDHSSINFYTLEMDVYMDAVNFIRQLPLNNNDCGVLDNRCFTVSLYESGKYRCYHFRNNSEELSFFKGLLKLYIGDERKGVKLLCRELNIRIKGTEHVIEYEESLKKNKEEH